MQEHRIAAEASRQDALIQSSALERQFRLVQRHYREACAAAVDARDAWRAMTVHAGARPAQIAALRAKFQAVAARCVRLRAVMEDLEYRLDY